MIGLGLTINPLKLQPYFVEMGDQFNFNLKNIRTQEKLKGKINQENGKWFETYVQPSQYK